MSTIIHHVTLKDFLDDDDIGNQDIFMERYQTLKQGQHEMTHTTIVRAAWFRNGVIHSWNFFRRKHTYAIYDLDEQPKIAENWLEAEKTLFDLQLYLKIHHDIEAKRGIVDLGNVDPVPGERWVVA